MSWYGCTNATDCGAYIQVVAIHVPNRIPRTPTQLDNTSPFFCCYCGSPAKYVMDGEESWWLTMERVYGYSRDLLQRLMREFNEQHFEPRFDIWLRKYLEEALTSDTNSG